MQQPHASEASASMISSDLRVCYVEYADVRRFLAGSERSLDANGFSEAVSAQLVKIYTQHCPTTSFSRDVLDWLSAHKGPSHDILEDYGVLAFADGRWRAFISGDRCSVTMEPLRLSLAGFQFSGTSVFVFLPDVSFVADDLAGFVGDDAPNCLIVSALSVDSAVPVTSILRPRPFSGLLADVASRTPGQAVEKISMLDLNVVNEDIPFARSRTLLTADTKGVVRVEMSLAKVLGPMPCTYEVKFLGTRFVDSVNMLGCLVEYFSEIARDYRGIGISALYTTMVQGSGWGKSRFTEQLLHRFPGCYTCFRGADDRGMPFPRSRLWAAVFLQFFEDTKGDSSVGQGEKEVFSLLYMCSLILAMAQYADRSLSQLLEPLSPMSARGSGLEVFFSKLEAEVADLESDLQAAADSTSNREAALRCKLLVSGQVSETTSAFGTTFISIFKYVVGTVFPRHCTRLLSSLQLSSVVESPEDVAAAEFCSSRGFTRDLLLGVKNSLPPLMPPPARDRSVRDLPVVSSSQLKNLICALGSLAADLLGSLATDSSRKVLLLAFDGATTLTAEKRKDVHGIVPSRYLQRALAQTPHLPIVALFVGTNPILPSCYVAKTFNPNLRISGQKFLQPLVPLPDKDVWGRLASNRLDPEEMHTFLGEMVRCQASERKARFLKKFSCIGHPIWQMIGEDALSHAKVKLGFATDAPLDEASDENARWLAVLGACCSIEVCQSSTLAMTLVRSYMATVANVCLIDLPLMFCRYVSDSVLASAAASVLFSRTAANPEMGLDRAVMKLLRALSTGAVDKSLAVALVSRILLMASKTRNMDFPFCPVTLVGFVDRMIMPSESESETETETEFRREFAELHEKLTSEVGKIALVNFVQFVQMTHRNGEPDPERYCITSEEIFAGLRRMCAFMMMPNFCDIDAIIPTSLSDGKFGYVGIKVSCYISGPKNPHGVFEEMLNAYTTLAHPTVMNPLNIYLHLGDPSELDWQDSTQGQGGRRKQQPVHRGYTQLALCNKPHVALYAKDLVRDGVTHRILFLHVFSVEAFAGAIPSEGTRTVLNDIVQCCPSYVELARMARKHLGLYDHTSFSLDLNNPNNFTFETL